MTKTNIGRRAVLGGGLAAVAGCMPCARLEPLLAADTRLAIADAHVHLFNAADLPVTGFFKCVVIPENLKDVPEVAAAMLDIATRVLKFFSISATDELQQMRAPWSGDSDDVSANAFAGRIKQLAEAEMAQRGFVAMSRRDPINNLGDSYQALATILNDVQYGGGSGTLSAEAPRALSVQVAKIDQGFLARVAEEGAAVIGPGVRALDGVDPAFVLSVIKWAFVMVQSRCGHAHRYLADMTSGTTKTTALLNLLVDYDSWLDDHPTGGSEMGAQVTFWTRYARAASERIVIKTFAGYDPLAHAESLIEQPGSAYFSERLRWFDAPEDAAQKIAGFKIYPPMGFNVDHNEALTATGRAADLVRDRWTQKRWDLAQLPSRLDAALDTFFETCLAKDIPIVAHGRQSEGAYQGSEKNADLRCWLKRAERLVVQDHGQRKLRASLAHYTALDPGWRIGMRGLLKLNIVAKKTEFFFDIGYCEELLKGAGKQLLDEIGSICDEFGDAGADWVMFGSDWIMLAQQPDHQEYVVRVDQAIAASDYWKRPGHREKLLGGNLRRFLRLTR